MILAARAKRAKRHAAERSHCLILRSVLQRPQSSRSIPDSDHCISNLREDFLFRHPWDAPSCRAISTSHGFSMHAIRVRQDDQKRTNDILPELHTLEPSQHDNLGTPADLGDRIHGLEMHGRQVRFDVADTPTSFVGPNLMSSLSKSAACPSQGRPLSP